MPYVVCAEEMDGRWVAHVPDLPGCFAADDERDAAIGAAPKAVEAYVAWCAAAGIRISGVSPPMVVSEVIRAWQYEPEYEVNAFFAADRPPVAADELPEYQRLLELAAGGYRAPCGALRVVVPRSPGIGLCARRPQP
jgi:predicted RNase H-like HicB family nuclease